MGGLSHTTKQETGNDVINFNDLHGVPCRVRFPTTVSPFGSADDEIEVMVGYKKATLNRELLALLMPHFERFMQGVEK